MEKLSEQLAVVEWIKPQVMTAGSEYLSGAVDMDVVERVMCVITLGAYASGNNGSVTVQIKASATSGGSYTAISGKQLTTANFTGSDGDEQIGVIEVDGAEVAAAGDYRYIKLSITPANQNLTAGAIILGETHYRPADVFGTAAVKEIVS